MENSEQQRSFVEMENQNLKQQVNEYKEKELDWDSTLTSQRAENLALHQDLDEAGSKKLFTQKTPCDQSSLAFFFEQLQQRFKEKEACKRLPSFFLKSQIFHCVFWKEAETRVSELENDLSRGVGEREHIKNELMDCQVQKSMLEAALSHQHNKTFTAQQGLHQARIFGKTVHLLI